MLLVYLQTIIVFNPYLRALIRDYRILRSERHQLKRQIIALEKHYQHILSVHFLCIFKKIYKDIDTGNKSLLKNYLECYKSLLESKDYSSYQKNTIFLKNKSLSETEESSYFCLNKKLGDLEAILKGRLKIIQDTFFALTLQEENNIKFLKYKFRGILKIKRMSFENRLKLRNFIYEFIVYKKYFESKKKSFWKHIKEKDHYRDNENPKFEEAMTELVNRFIETAEFEKLVLELEEFEKFVFGAKEEFREKVKKVKLEKTA